MQRGNVTFKHLTDHRGQRTPFFDLSKMMFKLQPKNRIYIYILYWSQHKPRQYIYPQKQCFVLLGLISTAKFISFWFCSWRDLNHESLDYRSNTLTTFFIKPWWLGYELGTRELNQLINSGGPCLILISTHLFIPKSAQV